MNAKDRPNDSAKPEGKKFDEEKIRYDLIPPEAMRALAQQLTYGANKYGDRNWEQGIRFGRLVRATTGHLWDWWAGEDFDEEGRPHLHGAITSLAMLLSLVGRHANSEWDDRPVKPSPTKPIPEFAQRIYYGNASGTNTMFPPVESVENSAEMSPFGGTVGYKSKEQLAAERAQISEETDQSTGENTYMHKRTLQRKILCTGESIEDAWDKRKHYHWNRVTCPYCLESRLPQGC